MHIQQPDRRPRTDRARSSRPVDVVHLGPQKSGTTWIYESLRQHPEVACARRDSIHYYDMFFHLGHDWYMEHFDRPGDDEVIFDTTPSYIRSLRAPERIYHDNPEAKLALTLRHPIDRGFSHYWHECKNPKRQFDFQEVLQNYDYFASWLESGFYAQHIERYLEYFDRKQLLCQEFETLERNPTEFLRDLLVFIGVEPDFTPDVLNIRVNEARVIRTQSGALRVKAVGALGRIFGQDFRNSSLARSIVRSRRYERGVERDFYNRLLEICVPEIERTEELLEIDLSHWKAFK